MITSGVIVGDGLICLDGSLVFPSCMEFVCDIEVGFGDVCTLKLIVNCC